MDVLAWSDYVIAWSTVAIVFVLGTLAVAAFVLYELSPFAHHPDVFHGRERQPSPHLD